MKYFAYGSNMWTRRLRKRAPTAAFFAVATLGGHVLRFHKRSTDRSGKCNALESADQNHEVIGVVFDINPSEKPHLDRIEGLGSGYGEKEAAVVTAAGIVPVRMYVADQSAIDNSLCPYTWYKDLVLAGAREHGLPAAYIRSIEAVASRDDPDKARDKRERASLSQV